MASTAITVLYSWTAQPGKLDELASVYADVTSAMKANEPGATAVHIYVVEDQNAIHVRDEFVDGDAVAFHLGSTAAQHFPSLLEIASPGTFSFFGDVPDGIRQAVGQMGLNAEYGSHHAGFDR